MVDLAAKASLAEQSGFLTAVTIHRRPTWKYRLRLIFAMP
jgi:hypothetical protein